MFLRLLFICSLFGCQILCQSQSLSWLQPPVNETIFVGGLVTVQWSVICTPSCFSTGRCATTFQINVYGPNNPNNLAFQVYTDNDYCPPGGSSQGGGSYPVNQAGFYTVVAIANGIQFGQPNSFIVVSPTTGTTHTTGTTGTIATTGSTGTTAYPCSQNGNFRTQSDGDWGDKCSDGFPTGCYRDTHFGTCFPTGLNVGCSCIKKDPLPCYSMSFSSSTAISNYLPQLGAPGSLDQNYIDPANPPPISTSSGTFGGQVTALALSIGFGSCDPTFQTNCLPLSDLYVCDFRCECRKRNNCGRNTGNCQNLRYADDGSVSIISRNNVNTPDGKPIYPNCEQYHSWTIGEIFQKANMVLGQCDPDCPSGNSDPTCDQSHLNSCLTFINQAFIFGKTLDEVASGTLFKTQPCS